MNVVITGIVCGIISTYIHKSKGYSPVAGFCWGFFFSIIGLIVVLLEKDKAEHDTEMANKKSLSVVQWFAIFMGVGILGFIILFMFL